MYASRRLIGSSAELVAILLHPLVHSVLELVPNAELARASSRPILESRLHYATGSICLWPAFDLPPASQNIPTAPKPYSGRRRSSRSCSNPIRLRRSDKLCQSQPFRVALRWRGRGVTLPHGSSQNLCWIPLGKRRLIPMAQFPTPSYNPGRRTRCTCSLATSNGNGGKTPAPPGNCCPRRKVQIRIRGPTPARCSSVPVISPAQGRVRRAGLAGSEDALTPRRTT